VAADPDERVLAWGELVAGSWLVATRRGLRVADGDVLPWHRIGTARWTAAGEGGTFTVVPLVDVEPGVQTREAPLRFVLRSAGELPAVLRTRVDRTVVTSQRHPLPTGGAVLLVARRVPGQAVREWTVVSDDDAGRDDPAARAVARERLAAAVDADDPAGEPGSVVTGVGPNPGLDRVDGGVGAGLGHAGGGLQARVVLGRGVEPADLLIAPTTGLGAEDVAGAEAGEEGQLGHEGPPGFGGVLTVPAGSQATRREPRPGTGSGV